MVEMPFRRQEVNTDDDANPRGHRDELCGSVGGTNATVPNLIWHPATGDIVLLYSPYLDAAQEYSRSHRPVRLLHNPR